MYVAATGLPLTLLGAQAVGGQGERASALETLDELGRHGVGFVSLRDAGIERTSPTGRLLLQMMGAFGEIERGLIRERCMAGH